MLLVTSLASAALYTLAQPPIGAWPLAYVCLVPWLGGVWSSLVNRDWRARAARGAMSGVVVGTCAALGCGAWVHTAVREFGAGPIASVAVTLLGALWVKGVQFGLLGALIGCTVGRGRNAWLLALPAGIAVLELLWSLPPWGAPWALLGHALAPQSGLTQLAQLGGVPLVSAIVALGNVLLAEVVIAPWRPRWIPASTSFLAGSLGVALVALPLLEEVRGSEPVEGGHSQALTLVQPDIPPGERWVARAQRTHLTAALEIANRAASDRTHPAPFSLFVLPEMLVTEPIERTPNVVADLRAFTERARSDLIVGVARGSLSGRRDRYRNSVIWVERDGSVAAIIDKQVSVPAVESGRALPLPPALAELVAAAVQGPRVEEVLETGDPRRNAREFAIALCYEVLFPSVIAGRRSQQTLAILNLSDDSWAIGGAPSEQQLAAATFRAIEQRLPIVRVAIHGPSVWIDPYGRRIAELPAGRPGWLTVELRTEPLPSLSERAALVVLLTLCAGGGWIAGAFLTGGTTSMRRLAAMTSLFAALCIVDPAQGETIATLTLDGLSFVSFGDREVFAIPSGSTVRFRFGAPSPAGSVPFTIQPADVAIAAIPLRGIDGTLRYGLASTASGTLRRGEDGRLIVEFRGAVAATLADSPEGSSTHTYSVRFTTEQAAAAPAGGGRTIMVEGMRLVPGAGYVQLVGGATNKTDGIVEPGAAVYTVLSGNFDHLPLLP